VKTSGPEFSDLAINEYVCMLIAQKAGLTLPEYHLSEDKRLFIMRGFDIEDDGQRLGTEYLCALMGIPADDKYDWS